MYFISFQNHVILKHFYIHGRDDGDKTSSKSWQWSPGGKESLRPIPCTNDNNQEGVRMEKWK